MTPPGSLFALRIHEIAYLTQRTVGEVRALVTNGLLTPLPATGWIQLFAADEVAALLRDPTALQRLRQIGRGELVVPRPTSRSSIPPRLAP